MENVITVTFSDKEIVISRVKLKTWIELNGILRSISQAAKDKDTSEFSRLMCLYLFISGGIPEEVAKSVPWYEVTYAYLQVHQLNLSRISFPIITVKSDGEVDPPPWDYEGREWFYWLHTLASEYGWSVEMIANLDIETGIALFQEIYTKSQMEKEWSWGLSEMAYPYDESTKASHFNPLPRPEWMQIQKVKKKITLSVYPIGFIPVGNIVNLSGMNLDGTPEEHSAPSN